MTAVRILKPSFQPIFPPQFPMGRPPLRVVPPLTAPPPTPGTGFGRMFGGVGLSISLLWTSKAAYDAVKAVPSQLPWMPGPSVAPEIWTDPKRVVEEAQARFGHIDTPQLNQLLFIREKQALPSRRDVMRNPHDRSLMIQDEDGNWVKIPLDGQETGALVISDLWRNGFPRSPIHERADDEVRLIEIELGRRSYQSEPKTDAEKSWFKRYAEYLRELAEAMRKRANGENVPLPIFIINTPQETKMAPKPKPGIVNSANPPANSPNPATRQDSPSNEPKQELTTGNTQNVPWQQNNKGIVASRYNRYSADYEGHSKRMGAAMDTTVRDYLAPHIRENTHLLDVAGGDGLATSLIGTSAPSITIMDLSSGMLEAAKTLRPNVKQTVEADFDNKFPFEDNTFDYTTCISALEFAANLPFTLRELFRVTKWGGLILITTDRLDDASEVQKGEHYVHDVNGFFSKRYRTEDIYKIISDMGGKVMQHSVHDAYRLEGKLIQYDYFLAEKMAGKP